MFIQFCSGDISGFIQMHIMRDDRGFHAPKGTIPLKLGVVGGWGGFIPFHWIGGEDHKEGD